MPALKALRWYKQCLKVAHCITAEAPATAVFRGYQVTELIFIDDVRAVYLCATASVSLHSLMVNEPDISIYMYACSATV